MIKTLFCFLFLMMTVRVHNFISNDTAFKINDYDGEILITNTNRLKLILIKINLKFEHFITKYILCL